MNGVFLLIVLFPSLILSNDTFASHELMDPHLLRVLSNGEHYSVVHSFISDNEKENGDYNYSDVTNVGMLYLYVHRTEGSRKENTKSEYARELLQFLRNLYGQNITDIRSLKRKQIEVYQKWLANRYPKRKTLAKKITILTGFLSWCFTEGYLKRDLTRGLVGVKLDRGQIPDRDIDMATMEHAIAYYASTILNLDV